MRVGLVSDEMAVCVPGADRALLEDIMQRMAPGVPVMMGETMVVGEVVAVEMRGEELIASVNLLSAVQQKPSAFGFFLGCVKEDVQGKVTSVWMLQDSDVRPEDLN